MEATAEVVDIQPTPPQELAIRVTEEGDEEGEGRVIEAVPFPGEDVIVFARTPGEMSVAQDSLVSWCGRKLTFLKREMKEAEKNLAAAKEAKIKTRPWTVLVKQAQRRIAYYTKIKAALDEGYFIVPDFPVNVIAVRTKKKAPTDAGNMHQYPSQVKEENPQDLPIGEGEYVDPSPPYYETYIDVEQKKYGTNEMETVQQKRYTTCREFDEIDFPIRLIRPQVIKSFSKAMQQKIFDSIGVLPNNRRNVDPMVIGTVQMKDGNHRKSVSFLITWFIPTQSL